MKAESATAAASERGVGLYFTVAAAHRENLRDRLLSGSLVARLDGC